MAATVAAQRRNLIASAIPLCAGIALCLMQLAIQAPDHDTSYLLDMAGQVLGGGRYFYDFLEINPPLYSLLLLPVYWLRDLTGIALYSCFIVWISTLITASSLAIEHYLRELLEERALSCALIAAATEAVLFILPGPDFGQRDHVCTVLILPWLGWMATARYGSRTTAVGWLVVIAAAIGVLIKPYLLLIAALAYAVRLMEQGNWRVLIEPPVWVGAAIAGLYVGLLVFVFPEWFTVVKTVSVAYAAYDAATWVSRRTVLFMAAIASLAAANEVFAGRNHGERRLGRFLVAAALGALGSYVVQHKDIEYQFIPARTLGWLLAGAVVLVGARWFAAAPLPLALGRWVRLLQSGRAIVVCLVVAMPLYRIGAGTAADSYRRDQSMRALAALLQVENIGPRVAVFGTSVYPAYPLALYRVSRPAWRFTHPWPITWIVRQTADGQGNAPRVLEMANLLRTMVVEDFRRFAPDAILVDETPVKIALPDGFDFMAWFRQDPAMAAILDQYERVAEFDDPNVHRMFFRRLGIYRRRPK